jgi:cyclophilin family peptidyl-prolyl cis-trans isomerase
MTSINKGFLYCLVFIFFLSLSGGYSELLAEQFSIKDPENSLIMQLKYGRVVISMRPDIAPRTVSRIKELVRQGFYDGLMFHRVLEGQFIQGGDPKGNGTGGSGFKLAPEFSSEKHSRGTVSMARGSDFNSADSQFFICLTNIPKFDGKYTIWGNIIYGIENIDKIEKGDSYEDGKVMHPDTIIWMKIASDLKE